MRVRNRIAVVALLGGISIAVAKSAFSKDEPGQAPPDMAEMMKKWTAAATPGEMHKHLEPTVGKWKTTTKTWWAGPGSEPMVSPGTAEVQWTLGGRYVSEVHKSSIKMPGPDGQLKDYEFEGHGLSGYDNFRKTYVFAWADNMGTQLLTGQGNYDPKTKTFTSYGQADEAMLDVYGRMLKYVHRIVDNDKHVLEIFDLYQGDGYKMVEITYERVK